MVYLTHRLLQSLQVVFLLRTQWMVFGDKCNCLRLTPGDSDTVAGRWNVNYTCLRFRESQAKCNASSLYFTYQIESGSGKIEVPLDYVRNINDSAIELRRFPEIEVEPGTARTRYVSCRIRGCEDWINADIRIMKPHENPQIKHIVVENWDILSFSWETKEDNT